MVFAGGQKAPAEGGGKIKMVLLMRNMNEQFLKDYAENMKKLAAANDVDLNIQDANNQPDTQLTQCQTALNQGYKFFVILPCESELSEPLNQMIQDHTQGTGGAAYSNIPNTTASLKIGKNFFFASSPETTAGNFLGQVVDEYFTQNPAKAPGKILNMLLVRGMIGNAATIYRESGMLDYLKKAGYTVNYIADDTANWSPDQAQQKMDAWIAAFSGKFNVVVAQNDGMALGCVESLIQSGFTKSDASDGTILTVPVFGVDATQEALNSMNENKLYATVLQSSTAQSTVAFNIILELAKTGSVAGKTIVGYAPATQIIDQAPADDPSVIGQCYLVPYAPVNKSNYKELLQ